MKHKPPESMRGALPEERLKEVLKSFVEWLDRVGSDGKRPYERMIETGETENFEDLTRTFVLSHAVASPLHCTFKIMFAATKG